MSTDEISQGHVHKDQIVELAKGSLQIKTGSRMQLIAYNVTCYTNFQSALTYPTNKFVEKRIYGKMLGMNLVFVNHLSLPVLLMCRGW